ncbi:MAG TPA: hypothetical protein VGD65_05775 [Chryseosolibacter sp.]
MIRKYALISGFLLLFFGCHNSAENTNEQSTNQIFTKSVGGPIAKDLADSWVARKRSHSGGREETFTVTADKLLQLLNQTDNKLGVNFHFAQDPGEQQHLFIAPVKSDLKSWTNGPVLDAATNEFADATQAMDWALSHKNQHPDGPWSVFFGSDLIDEITSKEGLDKIDIKPGEKEDGSDALLLFVSCNTQTTSGKLKSEESTYDQGALCPRLCPVE